MVGQSRPAVQAWQSAAVRSGEFKSDIDAASLATTSCKQDDSHGGEIFIGGTLEAKHHVATLYQISKQPICPEIDFIHKIMVVVPGGHFLH
jgi:hypothetical protein